MYLASLTVTSCWWRHVCRGIQPWSNPPCIQHKEKEQGRGKQHLLGRHLPALHIFYQAWICWYSRIQDQSGRWCDQVLYFQDQEEEILNETPPSQGGKVLSWHLRATKFSSMSALFSSLFRFCSHVNLCLVAWSRKLSSYNCYEAYCYRVHP